MCLIKMADMPVLLRCCCNNVCFAITLSSFYSLIVASQIPPPQEEVTQFITTSLLTHKLVAVAPCL